MIECTSCGSPARGSCARWPRSACAQDFCSPARNVARKWPPARATSAAPRAMGTRTEPVTSCCARPRRGIFRVPTIRVIRGWARTKSIFAPAARTPRSTAASATWCPIVSILQVTPTTARRPPWCSVRSRATKAAHRVTTWAPAAARAATVMATATRFGMLPAARAQPVARATASPPRCRIRNRSDARCVTVK